MIPIGDSVRSRTFPYVNLIIILVNIVVFLYELSLNANIPVFGGISELDRFIFDWSAMPACLADQFGFNTDPNVSQRTFAAVCSNNHVELSPFASMFMHGGWIHLIGNMIFLWVFGDNVEDAVGHIRYAIFYVVAGLAATVMHVFVNANSLTPTIGASGAIAGVLGAYLMLYPRATVAAILPIFIIFWIPFYVPSIFLIGLWFVMQLLNGYVAIASTDVVGTGGVAWFAHIGGFVAGFVLVRLFTMGRPPPPKVATHYRRRSA